MDDAARRALRNTFGSFATGVTVITTRERDGTPRGFTANSFASVSLDPPLLLVCLGKSARSCDVFAGAEHFGVNILTDQQKDISGLFASQSPDKFALAPWHAGPEEVPLIDDALAGFACARHQVVDAGDHLILIGRVIWHHAQEGMPLGFFRGEYFDLGLENTLVEAATEGNRGTISAVLSRDGAVLLKETLKGTISVPRAPERDNTHNGLIARLTCLSLTPKLDHLFAVYQSGETGDHTIVYHGTVDGAAPEGMRYHDLATLPLDRVASDAERSMLARYQREYRHGKFGIYHGTDTAGVVHAVAEKTDYTI